MSWLMREEPEARLGVEVQAWLNGAGGPASVEGGLGCTGLARAIPSVEEPLSLQGMGPALLHP